MPDPQVHIILRNDDPCALSNVEHERRVLSVFARHGVPHLAAVIPRVVADPHDHRCESFHALRENPEMVELLRSQHAAGLLEVALHGETHRTNPTRPSLPDDGGAHEPFAGIAGPWLPMRPAHPDGYSEFAGLPFHEQLARITRGRADLEATLGVRPTSFVFPWNTADRNALRAVRKAGLDCVLGGDDRWSLRGLLILEACFWWEPGEDQYSELVEDALQFPHPALLHLSFHSWMLGDRDIELLDQFIGRYVKHPAVAFTTPDRLPVHRSTLRRCVALRRRVQVARAVVLRRVWLWEHDDPLEFYLLSPRYYLGKLWFIGPAALVSRTVGLRAGLLISAAAAALVAGAKALAWSPSTTGAVTATATRAGLGVLLAGALLLAWRSLQLLHLRRRQRRATHEPALQAEAST